MAALLAGARLVLRQGLRFVPACTLRPAPVPVRCFSSSARFLTTAAKDKDAFEIENVEIIDYNKSVSEGWSLHEFGTRLKKTGRISRSQLRGVLNTVCQGGIPSSTQSWFLLQACGSTMPSVPPSERMEIADRVWSKLQQLGVVFNETHYNALLKLYLENEHKFSPTDFLSTMEEAQVQPDQTTYEGLIAAYCNEGDIQGASKILGFMKSTNLPVTESVFSSLIRGHARSGDMESAKGMLSIMEGAGLIPGIRTYETLLCAYAEKGDIEGINQTLQEFKVNPTDLTFLNVIYCLAKAGHSQFVPDILERMHTCKGHIQEVINLCLRLLTLGCGDTALQVAKRFLSTQPERISFANQPGSFFIRQCVSLNMPVSVIKKYATELKESKLLASPLQFALFTAMEHGKKDLALDLLRTLKEEGLPVKPHYCWPLLASFHNENNVQGFLQVLRVMKETGVTLDLDTFRIYVANFFANVESPESILKENEFQEDFNELYLSTVKTGLSNKNLKRVYVLLSSKIPFVKDTKLMHILFRVIPRSNDVEILAKITKLLYQDGSSLQNPSSETESVGYFLYGLIGSLNDSEVRVKEEHLKQYFHQLKEMGVRIDRQKAENIIRLLKTYQVPQLIKDIRELSSQTAYHEPDFIPNLEKQLEEQKTSNLPYTETLISLLNALVEAEEVEKVLELTSKHGSDFSSAIYMEVLGLCCRKNKPKEALKIKDEVYRRGFTNLSTAMYMHLLEVLAVNGLIEDAINILKEMQERNVTVDDVSDKSFARILNILATKGEIESVNRLHEHIVMLGLAKPTGVVCVPLVMVHIHQNDLPAALDAMIECNEKYKCCPMENGLLLKLVQAGETELLKKAVDYIGSALGERAMLNDLLFVFIESKKYVEAQKIAETPGLRAIPKKIKWIFDRFARLNLVEAMEKSMEITRDLYGSDREDMYLQLLCLYEKNNDWAKTIPLWHKMKEEAIIVQDKTRDQFIRIFKKNYKYIYAHIPEFNQESAQAEHTSLIKSVMDLCKQGNIKDAFSLFLKTKQDKEILNRAAYVKLINELLKAGQLEDALDVEDVAKSHFRGFNIRNSSSNLFLAEQVRRDCLKDALVTLETLLSSGKKPSFITLKKLGEAFAMKGDVGSLEKMEAMTASSKYNPHKMSQLYINTKLLAHFRNENFEEATSKMESLFTENKSVSLWFLFKNLLQNDTSDALDKASIVVERLSTQFSVYRPVTDLFLAYVRTGKEEEAKQLLQRCSSILEQSKSLIAHIVRQSIRGQKEYIDQLLDILNEPVYKQVGYSSLIEMYANRGKLDDALALYEKLKAIQIEPNKTALKKLAVALREAGMPVPFPEPQGSVQLSNEEEIQTSSSSDEEH